MRNNPLLIAVAVSALVLSGCKGKDAANDEATAAAAATPSTPSAQDGEPAEPAPEPATEAGPTAAAAQAGSFDIGRIPVSGAALPAWPMVTLPAGYVFDDAAEAASRTKDLARVPIWTGNELLWIEGKVFTDRIEAAEGKTYSKFELRKGLAQMLEGLGAVRIAERTYPREAYMAQEQALSDFHGEFGPMNDAYWYDQDVDTWVIRRADRALWVVFRSTNSGAGLMVVDGPLPPPAKPN